MGCILAGIVIVNCLPSDGELCLSEIVLCESLHEKAQAKINKEISSMESYLNVVQCYFPLQIKSDRKQTQKIGVYYR